MATAVTSRRAGWRTAATGVVRTLAATSRAAVTDVVTAAGYLAETTADGVLGRDRGESVLRVAALVLSDDDGPLCAPEQVAAAIRAADAVLRPAAGIRVVDTGVAVITAPAPAETLDPGANQRLLLDDVLGRTGFYTDRLPMPGAVGAPVTVVVVREIAGRTTGCSLGMTADWVVCQRSLFDPSSPTTFDPTVLAHELGHALNLPHHPDRANLMFPASSPPDDVRGTALVPWQRAVLRANRHTLPGTVRRRD